MTLNDTEPVNIGSTSYIASYNILQSTYFVRQRLTLTYQCSDNRSDDAKKHYKDYQLNLINYFVSFYCRLWISNGKSSDSFFFICLINFS